EVHGLTEPIGHARHQRDHQLKADAQPHQPHPSQVQFGEWGQRATRQRDRQDRGDRRNDNDHDDDTCSNADIDWRMSSHSTSSGNGTARHTRWPWATSQPRFASVIHASSVSTPSATVSIPNPLARSTIALTRCCWRSLWAIPVTKLASIFSRSTVKSRSMLIDEYPVPKSSIATRTPASRS